MHTVDQILDQAKSLHAGGRLQEAEQLYQQVLAIEADNAEAYRCLGAAQAQQGKLDAAIGSFRDAVRLRPTDSESFKNLWKTLAIRENKLGTELAKEGKLSEAEAHYREALHHQPDYLAAHGNLGNVLREQGRYNEAAACYERVLSLEPRLAQAHFDLGAMRERQGRFVAATSHLQEAVALRPDMSDAHAYLGHLLFNRGKLDEAEASYRRALELNPDLAQALYDLSLLMSRKERAVEAEELCRRALAIDPALANVLPTPLDSGRLSEVVASLRGILIERPEFAEVHHQLGVVLARHKRPLEAIECFQSVLGLRNDHAEAHSQLAGALLQTGQVVEAIACCRRALTIKPALPEAHINLGLAFAALRQWTEATQSYRDALAINSESADAYMHLSEALVEQRHFREAESAAQNALKLAPTSADAHQVLGLVLGRQNLPESIACFRQAIALRPDFAAAHHSLGTQLAAAGRLEEAAACFHQALLLDTQRVDSRNGLDLVLAQLSQADRIGDQAPALLLSSLQAAEKKMHSQNGEDGVIDALFSALGTTNRFFVEFGVEDGTECNAAHLIDQGWTGLFMDGQGISNNPRCVVQQEFITAENINDLFRKYNVPAEFDLLSIDIDGNDFWVWQQIAARPRVVVIEYNPCVPPDQRLSIAYDPSFRWTGTDYHGASLRALKELGERKAYTLVYCERTGTNAFFVANETLPQGFVPPGIEEIYRMPNYFGEGIRHPRDESRTMIDPFGPSS